jgi:hypothetical protein
VFTDEPGGFGAVTITKSITIDCHEVFASILNSGTNGINIPFNNFAAADVRKTVRLRNLNLNGINTGIVGIRIAGGSVIAGGTIIIEDCLIDGNFAGSSTGLFDERTAGGRLFISNTTVRNTGDVRVTINRPVLAGNSFAGIFASGTSTEVNASNSVISSNATGVQNAAARSPARRR